MTRHAAIDASCRGGAARRAGLAQARGGAVALEFALIATVFFGLVLFTVFLGFRLYAELALGHAASRVARQLAVDSSQSLTPDQQTFQSASFCPLLSGFLSCANLVVSLQPVTDYLAASSTAPPIANGVVQTTGLAFSPGQGGSLMLLQATYVVPIPGWPWPASGVVGFQGAKGIAVTVDYPYQNEY